MTTVLGIDEAGRGSVIGPMVLAGVLVDKRDLKKLQDMGVKDSKLLTPEQRESLYPLIKKISIDHVSLSISAEEIDETRKKINLNRIEAVKMAQVLKAIKADEAYIDAPQKSTDKFKKILEGLSNVDTKLIVENYADKNYVICGAASVIAKVERDREIEKIKKETSFDLGVGYSHDARSIEFVKKFLKHRDFSKYIRHSWITVSDIKDKMSQKSLKNF